MFRTWISREEGGRPVRRSPDGGRDVRPPFQEGFTLAGLIVILTIISVIIAYTVPEQWSMIMHRERDRQTIFLMKQFARSIDAWTVKNNNARPTSLDQIYDARRPRMIRGVTKWACPLTGREGDWILVPEQAIVNRQPGGGGGGAGGGAGGAAGAQAGWSQLNPELSPKEYANGPFVGVRPNKKGPSFLELNGAGDYNEWVYTVYDLQLERQMRQAALAAK
ncbi:MAG TPA: type II secretion system protein [Thermoanaerobaculia bacterium]|nr:type II secretion system protein [Thermoanaerobaculia bacterium]